jgi:hypothetical protein
VGHPTAFDLVAVKNVPKTHLPGNLEEAKPLSLSHVSDLPVKMDPIRAPSKSQIAPFQIPEIGKPSRIKAPQHSLNIVGLQTPLKTQHGETKVIRDGVGDLGLEGTLGHPP